ncbi:MAG: CoA ester lyase [Phenylobacterium sp.]|uniref:HpcH/HpaI aldolase/citrate lyase family protein n=1 Tax=Phenylobacterium sp. TaxID=1871053 RepID=UPI0027229725|nr:CoA ester lyase [Phenylobacterium sp.]MDO8910770.1 CoA ester lyase [Phenylobacterium sp.]MDO9247417.1 CoA ester lyase [Phenylobacterium sp.]MDP1987833.1 CoA ester lyase [Phenylobacterium sp.]MDP3100978.1 CoA ester lyase [Phenylobacterium sp.]MDP3632554.1 CoA ester lyase [Phenylobacterium sp.]
MIAARPRRSALYMPAANARAIEKARDLTCDVVILDLEDAVAPDAKAIARQQAVEAVKAGGFGRREVVIRVNGLDTPWGAEDLAAAAAACPDAILAPKVSSAADVAAYDAGLSGETRLWVMIETCASLFALESIAACGGTSRLDALVIGTNDLAKEMRCRLTVDRAPLVGPLSLSVAAARAHGLTILDGVHNGIADEAGLVRQCAQGAEFGFDGKTLIHPGQIEAANTAFSPAPGEVHWARIIVAAFDSPENAAKGVLRIEGRMVERLHLVEAQRLIAVADAIAAA